jgi:hypothetical protein
LQAVPYNVQSKDYDAFVLRLQERGGMIAYLTLMLALQGKEDVTTKPAVGIKYYKYCSNSLALPLSTSAEGSVEGDVHDAFHDAIAHKFKLSSLEVCSVQAILINIIAILNLCMH